MTKKPEITLLYRIAKSYYIDKLSQNQIAEMENISRSQISRLLDRAEKMGIVRVSVALPDNPDLSALAESVAKGMGLERVVVAPIDEDDDSEARMLDAIAVAAAQFLPRELKGSRVVGLGWGRTMYRTSLGLSYRNVGDELTYVPLVGLSGTTDPCLQINTIIDRVAERHRARSYFVGVPAYRETQVQLSDIDEQRIWALEQYWNRLDAAVFGLGCAPSEDGLFVSEIGAPAAKRIAESGAVGDILAQFFMADGRVVGIDDQYKQVVFGLQRLRKVKKTICLAGGANKIEGIMAAAKLGYFNMLVTDSRTAMAFYDIIRSRGE